VNPRHLQAVFIARNREFWRDKAALAWNFAFPVLLIIGFAFGFSEDSEPYNIGVYGTPTAPLAFTDSRYINTIDITDLEASILKVERHQLDLLIDFEKSRYWVNSKSERGYFLEHALANLDPDRLSRQPVSGDELRYVDWVIPGVLAMNVMFSALFGIGYVIVRYRKNGVLKRLKATPLSALEFLLAQLASRLWLILVVNVIIFVGCDLIVDFRMYGDYLSLLFIFLLGAISLISMGLMVAARTASEELAGGLLNLFSWPMMFLSGVWFSIEGLQPWVQTIAQIFPLTHMISAARAVMIDGAGIIQVFPEIMVLCGMSCLFLLIGSYLFRWE